MQWTRGSKAAFYSALIHVIVFALTCRLLQCSTDLEPASLLEWENIAKQGVPDNGEAVQWSVSELGGHTGGYGGFGGTSFLSNPGQFISVRQITVRSGVFVDSIQVTYTNNQTFNVGGSGGIIHEDHVFQFEGGEILNSITFYITQKRGGVSCGFIIRTNLQSTRFGPLTRETARFPKCVLTKTIVR